MKPFTLSSKGTDDSEDLKMTHTQQRLVVGGIATAIVLIFIWLSPYQYFKPFYTLVTAAIVGGAVWEYYQIAKNKGFQPLETIGIVSTVAYLFAVFLTTESHDLRFLPEIILWLTLLMIFINYFVNGPNPFVNTAVTLFAIGYLTIPLSTLITITYFFPADSTQDGRIWLLYLIAVTKMTDTGAFFVGKAFGKHKLAPYISPGKTWEGAIGGFITALLTGFALNLIFHAFYEVPPFDLNLFRCIWLAGIISVIAQFSDLAESLLKRDVGVKDSNQLPGLGGMLDIVDSLVFTAPVMYIYLKMQTA